MTAGKILFSAILIVLFCFGIDNIKDVVFLWKNKEYKLCAFFAFMVLFLLVAPVYFIIIIWTTE